MKKIILSLCLFIGSLNAVAHDGVNDADHKIMVDQTNPYDMINQVAEITFKRFANEQKEIQINTHAAINRRRARLVKRCTLNTNVN